MNRDQFLRFVRDYVAADPEVTPSVTEAASLGVRAALDEAKERAADMEVALTFALSKTLKGKDAKIRDTLRKWHGKTSLNWSSLE